MFTKNYYTLSRYFIAQTQSSKISGITDVFNNVNVPVSVDTRELTALPENNLYGWVDYVNAVEYSQSYPDRIFWLLGSGEHKPALDYFELTPLQNVNSNNYSKIVTLTGNSLKTSRVGNEYIKTFQLQCISLITTRIAELALCIGTSKNVSTTYYTKRSIAVLDRVVFEPIDLKPGTPFTLNYIRRYSVDFFN